jgi:D-alanine-D-alanine ligase-like ATP-grasp enzyme
MMDKKQRYRVQWPYGLAELIAVPGAANGLSVPSMHLLLETSPVMFENVSTAGQGLRRLVVLLEPVDSDTARWAQSCAGDLDTQMRAWLKLMSIALSQLDASLAHTVPGLPQCQLQKDLFTRRGQGLAGYLVFWPSYWPLHVLPLLAWSLGQWHTLAQLDGEEPLAAQIEAGRRQWRKGGRALRRHLPPGLNAARLLAAAAALKRPVHWLDRDIMQLGHGRRARLLCSTLTDATPSIGVVLARDKVRTSRLLHQAGLPVPLHAEAADAEAALVSAQQLGWPVVVKPADQDRGDGARANLHTPEQVTAAFAHASAFSKRVLVEQHIQGLEYRLTVVNGELLWAHERVPAAVVGDGLHSLQALIEAENARRHQALQTDFMGWVPIQMDVNNLSYLEETGRSLQGIPAVDETVRLQRVPAATTGGGGKAYFDTIHPDNRLLAERAARLLRLDIAGVDLIMPDITRSWREVGGAVTEVNAIPQISIQTDLTLAERLLQKVMPHSGRIPLLFVLADGAPPTWVDSLTTKLETAGLRVGVTATEGLFIGSDWIRGPRTSLWDDIRALQMDPNVGVIVIVSDGEALLKTGLPFDAVDCLVVLSRQPKVLSLLEPYVRGFKALVGDRWRAPDEQTDSTPESDWQSWSDSEDALPVLSDALLHALLKAEAVYASSEDASRSADQRSRVASDE